jgi:hypothetical protein
MYMVISVKCDSRAESANHAQNEHYEPSDNPDLTPTQLASFYRDLDGNYDQLFLGTPGASIAFIYKSLGCLHSLQPLPHSVTFTDPTVPALKTEGWIMWQTIQILLGPEEHSKFLMEAVRHWDIKDPNNGEILPKILPRQCFPASPDKHMVAWYEGVSERLRTEAEEEIRRVENEKEADRSRVTVKPHDTDDEGSVDSRGPALAYFRNPLYRHVDASSTAVPPGSRRPAGSPRPSSLRNKSKEAAAKFGHVMKNVASPHLWDGHAYEREPEHRHGSRNGSRDRDRERKRRSLPHHMPGDPPPERDPYDEQLPPPGPMQQPPRHHRRRSSRLDPRPTVNRPDDDWGSEGQAPSVDSRDPSPRRSRPGPRDFNDPHVRHSKSHEPTPTQRDIDDYFQAEEPPSGRRRASAFEDSPEAPPRPTGIGPSFAPSAAPLFASHVARQPPPPQLNREMPLPGPPPPPPMNYDPRQYPGPPNRRLRPPRHPDMDVPPPPNRSRNRPPSSRSPPRRRGSRPSGSRPLPPYDDRPEPRRRSRPPPPGPIPRYDGPRDYPPDGPGREPRRRSRQPSGPPPPRYPDPRDDLYSSGEESMSPPPSPDDRRPRRHSQRRSRGGGPDVFDEAEGIHSAPEGPDRRGGPGRKVTRFADAPMSGVDGRRYPEAAPWR